MAAPRREFCLPIAIIGKIVSPCKSFSGICGTDLKTPTGRWRLAGKPFPRWRCLLSAGRTVYPPPQRWLAMACCQIRVWVVEWRYPQYRPQGYRTYDHHYHASTPPPRHLRPRLGNHRTTPLRRPRQGGTPRPGQPPLHQHRVLDPPHWRTLARPAPRITDTGTPPHTASGAGKRAASGPN